MVAIFRIVRARVGQRTASGHSQPGRGIRTPQLRVGLGVWPPFRSGYLTFAFTHVRALHWQTVHTRRTSTDSTGVCP